MTTNRIFTNHRTTVEELNIMHKLPAEKRTAMVRAYEVLARRALGVLGGYTTPIGFARMLAQDFKLSNPPGVSKMSLDEICRHWLPVLTEIHTPKYTANSLAPGRQCKNNQDKTS
jgi:hypothetical protein